MHAGGKRLKRGDGDADSIADSDVSVDPVTELRGLLNEAKEREVLLLEAYEQLERCLPRNWDL